MADIATILARGDLKALAEVPADRLREYLLTEMENERKEAVPGGDRWISLGMKFGRAGRPDAERVLLDSLTNQPSKETLDLVSLFLLGFWFRRACPERPSPLTMDTFLRESERLTLDATSRAAVAYFLCEALQNGLDAPVRTRVVSMLNRLEGESGGSAEAALKEVIHRCIREANGS